MSSPHDYLMIGMPNSGKTLLFNRLTGYRQKVANFPGVTVSICSGTALADKHVRFIDFPGVYSLNPLSSDERIAVSAFQQALSKKDASCTICMVDATRLANSLFFALQVIKECQQAEKAVIIVCNMMDVLKRNSVTLDYQALAQTLGVPVFPLSAKTELGIAELEAACSKGFQYQQDQVGLDLKEKTTDELRSLAQNYARSFSPQRDVLIRSQSRLDSFFLHSFFGGVSFFAIMYLLFQAIFTWSEPLMDAVEFSLAWSAERIIPLIPYAPAADFTRDALFSGMGAFLVFVPQIFVLTFIVGLLEDSGYLARAAVICHRPLRLFGLTGKSFIPMLAGVACAIPGIYAARTIESPLKRFLTYMAIPMMPCSARLPVYSLLIYSFIPNQALLGGLIGYRGFAMFSIFLFGILTALLVTGFTSRFRKATPGGDIPFVLEMPPYRVPDFKVLVHNAFTRAMQFVTRAGGVIFSVTVIIWILSYFPNYGTNLSSSWLGAIGQWIGPIFAPLGLPWEYGVAILTSFLAREVFVSTLGTMLGVDAADENIANLAERIQASGLSPASGIALLVFFAIALQCVSTLSVLRRESGSWHLPVLMFTTYSILAYSLGVAIVAFFG